MEIPCVLAIDPGRVKCGMAVVERSGAIIARQITPREQLAQAAAEWLAHHALGHIVLGDSTASQAVRSEISALLPEAQWHIVDETGTTLEARALFWQLHPPRGWRRYVPLSLQLPPMPLDDLAAVLLARRFFAAF